MHEEEIEPMEEQEQPMEGDRELQAYNLIKNREFIHTPAYDPDLLQKIGMGTEFATIWKVVGWENVATINELCRRTDQFIRVQVQWRPTSGRTVILEPI